MKKIVRSIIIFWGIFCLFPLVYLVYVFFTDGPGSLWLFGVGDGQAFATTWFDDNANGIKDPGEKPFAKVCVWHSYSLESGNDPDFFCKIGSVADGNLTDERGQSGRFLPGGKCSEAFVFAKVPQGFQATTTLVSDGCDAKFGFVAKDVQVKQKIVSVDEFIWQRNFFTWVTRIVVSLIILVVSLGGTIWLQKTP